MILDGNAIYGKTLAEFLAWKDVRALGIKRGWAPPRLDDVAEADPLPAWIQQGHLVVTCPECRDKPENVLHAVWLPGPLVIFCVVCGNAATGGKLRPVVLPAEYEAIVALLAVRPLPARSWLVGEGLNDLRAENVQHGWGEESG